MPRSRLRRSSNLITEPSHYLHPDLDAHCKCIVQGMAASERHYITPTKMSAVGPYAAAARNLWLIISPFLDIVALVIQLDKKLDAAEDQESELDLSITPAPDSFLRLIEPELLLVADSMPCGRDRFLYLLLLLQHYDATTETAWRDKFIGILDSSFKSGRAQITKEFKECAPRYLSTAENPIILSSRKDKNLRGFNHDAFGAAIVGISKKIEYLANPRKYCEDIRNAAKVHSRNQGYPSFLYPRQHVYNRRDPERQLGEGEFFIQCLQHILSGPSTAGGGSPASRNPSKSHTLKLASATPRILASILAQAYIACSSMSIFAKEDGEYSIEGLFDDFLLAVGDGSAHAKAIMDRIQSHIIHFGAGPKEARWKALPSDETSAANDILAYHKAVAEREAERANHGDEHGRSERSASALEGDELLPLPYILSPWNIRSPRLPQHHESLTTSPTTTQPEDRTSTNINDADFDEAPSESVDDQVEPEDDVMSPSPPPRRIQEALYGRKRKHAPDPIPSELESEDSSEDENEEEPVDVPHHKVTPPPIRPSHSTQKNHAQKRRKLAEATRKQAAAKAGKSGGNVAAPKSKPPPAFQKARQVPVRRSSRFATPGLVGVTGT